MRQQKRRRPPRWFRTSTPTCSPSTTRITSDRKMERAATLAISGCKSDKVDAAAEAPPPAKVAQDFDANLFSVDHPDNFPLFAAAEHRAPTKLAVTGVVNPDIARMVPVISLASGRIVGIYARLGDTVKKGQRLLKNGTYNRIRNQQQDRRFHQGGVRHDHSFCQLQIGRASCRERV